MAFDAFISYSHAADGRLAPALQRAIQRLAKPWYRARALRVFRDESALSANPHLWSSIQTAMDDAEWFVLLASPDAVASEWVNRELAHWVETKSADRILVVVTDGTWEWDANAHAMTGTAVPPALKVAFGDEPRHVDLRWAAAETDLDMHHARFRDVVAQLAAPMHGIAKDELDSEDVRQHRRARRLARGGVTALTLLVVVSLVFGVIAAIERGRANRSADNATRRARIATAERLGALSTFDASNNENLALLLGVEAFRRNDSTTTRSALLGTLAQNPQLVGFMPGPADAKVGAISPDGKIIVSGTGDGSLRFWLPDRKQAETRLVRPPPPLRGDAVVGLAFDRDGHRLYVAYFDGRVQVWDTAREEPIGAPLRIGRTSAQTIAVNPSGTRIAVSGFGQPVAVWDTRARGVVAKVAAPNQPISAGSSLSLGGNSDVAYSADGKMLFTSGSQGLLAFDAATNQQIGAPLMTYSGADGYISTAENAAGRTLVVTGVGRPPTGSTPGLGTTDGVTTIDAGAHKVVADIGDAASYTDLALSHDGSFVVLGGTNGTISISSPVEKEQLGPTLRGQGAEIESVSLAADNRRLVSIADNGSTVLWDLAGSQGLARATQSNVLTYPTARTGMPRHAPKNAELKNDSLLPGSNFARYFVAEPPSQSVSPPVVTVDISTGRRLGVLHIQMAGQQLVKPHRTAPIFEVAPVASVSAYVAQPQIGIVDFQGQRAATTSFFGDVFLWDARTGALLGHPILSVGSDPIASALAFSFDGKELAVGRSDGTIARYSVPSLRRIGNLITGQTSAISQLAYQPGGSILASASGDAVRLIDLAASQVLARIPFVSDEPFVSENAAIQGAGGGTVVQFSASGRQLLTDGYSDALTRAFSSESQFHSVAEIRAAMKKFGSGDIPTATSLLWSMVPTDWERAACQAAGRNLTRTEWTQLVGDEPYRRTCSQWPAGT